MFSYHFTRLTASVSLALASLVFSIGASAELKQFSVESDNYQTHCGFKNENGQIVVPAKYDYCGDFSDGMAYIGNIGTGDDLDSYYVGYINDSGKEVIPARNRVENMYSNLMFKDYHEGLVATFKPNGYNEEYGVYDDAGKYGYMNKSGKLVIPYQYERASDFTNGKAIVCNSEKCGIIDISGQTIVPFKFDYLDDFSEGLASFQNDSESGYIDSNGKIVIRGQWDELMPFSEGRAAVKIGDYETGKWGIIDRSGKLIVPIKYDNAYIDPMGDSLEVDGGIYENGTIDMYDIDYDSSRFTRYRFDTTGKLDSKKTFSDWSDIERERHPEYYQ